MAITAPVHHDAPVRYELPGVGESRAYWVDETTLAWPTDLLPAMVDVEALRVRPPIGTPAHSPVIFGLVAAPKGGARIVDGILDPGPDSEEIPLCIHGTLEDLLGEEAMTAHPALRGYLALSLEDEFGSRRVEREDITLLLAGQLAVVQRTAASTGGWITAFTGVQTWPLLDRLYADAAARDGSAPLGAVVGPDGAPSFALWAPTAVDVSLLAWPTGDPTGSVPLVDGDPIRVSADRSDVETWDGRWEVSADVATAAGIDAGSQYLWEVRVYVPATGEIETNLVTDPYSRALTVDSRRSVVVDLSQRALKPSTWRENLSPVVGCDAARAIYELHVRDFSVADASVPEELRGTYAAFTLPSAGTRHLRQLAAAGIDTLHLLPTFDFCSVPEDRAAQRTPRIPEHTSPASRRPQAAVAAVSDEDAYNWGYDPWHWMTPEGSYARAGRQDGGARVHEFREMVGAIHGMGLQVVLDQVFNHTGASGQDPHSVLDRIVPGYYHRLDAAGNVEMSTCCNNVATEHRMAERLMIDACVSWVVDYRVDGFRFDLMGYHSLETMERLQNALDQVADDAVGHPIYLYGEGWNMGEVANNALFTQATQGQVGALGIGAFNDRVRDAVHGRGKDTDPRVPQGLGNGELTDPNGYDDRSEETKRADLAWRADLVRLALAGNLRDFELPTADGHWIRGEEVRYGDEAAAYGLAPTDSINYVDVHDDETLFDRLAYKLPPGTPMAERIRMNTLCLAMVTLGQSPCFWAAGTELLRSKSLDTDSYDSGDHFNAIDWSGCDNGWGRGLPPAGRNFDTWVVQAGILMREDLRPTTEDIAIAREQALDLLRLRRSTPLFSLGSAALIRERVSFPTADHAAPGLIIMLVDDGAGDSDIDPDLDGLLVAINPSPWAVEQRVDALVDRYFVLSDVQAEGADPIVKTTRFDAGTGSITVPGRTVAVLYER
ncbi:pullulanase-type alpha-1,6-glucosidase [Actinomyces sp. MRS3W]|uniref:pullulanase-type alpha-1,6-glucosidase n=1 Tax=Actinomyces sp. MRS3W TaxID=2800796 RepID=UPI0028FD59F5|nr:pullulanase-type alpha-1,6-glucosidase [Actinomyces sp. MRS3W]MDU0348293.1 pullulanase-type alpha-1,6-glucosidase [Actinomyces sp. MRS3W]